MLESNEYLSTHSHICHQKKKKKKEVRKLYVRLAPHDTAVHLLSGHTATFSGVVTLHLSSSQERTLSSSLALFALFPVRSVDCKRFN